MQAPLVTRPSKQTLMAWIVLLLAGCHAKESSPISAVNPFAPQIQEKLLPEEGHILEEVDLNGDQQPDIYNYYRERSNASRLLLRKEVDLNLDGRVDIISHFDDDGTLQKEEMDGDYDGRIDWVDHYRNGVRVMSEYDTDFDGRPNVYKYFAKKANGSTHLDRKERDTNGDGNIDYWERFDVDGQVIRTARDTDGDGKMDVREE